MKAVLGLVPHGRLRPVEDVLGDLLAVVGREAVEDDCARSRLLHEVGGDAVAVEVAEPLLALGVLPHARPDVRVEDVAAAPEGYRPDPAIVASCREDAEASGGAVEVVDDPREAVSGAQVLYTDVWTSMGQEEEHARRLRDLAPFRLDEEKLALAASDAVAMHCLPAHVDEEITEGVLYGERSAVWDQAENRLHVYKAVLALTVR